MNKGATDLEATRQYIKNVQKQRKETPEMFLDKDIRVVIVKFRTGSEDLYSKRREWVEGGGYQGFLKNFCISILDIYEVKHETIKESEYPTTEWGG
jgi:hypothetical protein